MKMPNLENITIDDALKRTVEKYPSKNAITYLDKVWTYGDFDKTVELFSGKLITLGVNKGSHVGLIFETSPEMIFLIFAILRIGGVVVMINPDFHLKEISNLLKRTDVDFLITEDHFDFLCSKKDYGVLKKTIDFSGFKKDIKPDDFSVISEMKRNVFPSDDAFILFTSGSTDLPKPVVITHYSMVNSGLQQGFDQGTTKDDIFCVAMPAFHCFCLSVNIMSAFFYGACICIPESRHTETLLSEIEKNECTVFSSVPAIFHAIISKGKYNEYNISSLRTGFIGGSPYPASLFKTVESSLGFTLLSSLGQTEATAGFTVSFIEDSMEERSTTVGHFMPYIEHRFTEDGEICVKGYCVMKGYYNDPEETGHVIDTDGWLHTGDLGHINKNGNLVLDGRKKELIIRGGENISPLEIEAIVMERPEIREVKAVGVKDLHYGEEIALCVVKSYMNGKEISEKDIKKIYESCLGKYKIPRYILFFNSLPKLSSGKIDRSNLIRLAEKKIADKKHRR